jgi:transposase
VERFYVGVDLHRTVIQVCVLDEGGEIVRTQRYRGAEERGECVRSIVALGKGAEVGVEAVGVNRWFVNALRENGVAVDVLDASRLGLREKGRKTDWRDALEIARTVRMKGRGYEPTYYPSEQEYATRKLIRVRHVLVRQRLMTVNQIRSMLNAYAVEGAPTKLWTQAGLSWLEAQPWEQPGLLAAMRALGGLLRAIQEQIEKLKGEIEAVAAQDKAVASAVESLPGAAALTATTLIYELGDVARFRGPRAAAAYAGIVPRVANSGDRSHHGRLAKSGSSELRWILSQWAVRLLAYHPLARQWAEPLRRRLHGNKIRIALARRLLVGVYVTLSRGETFSLERCLQGKKAA